MGAYPVPVSAAMAARARRLGITARQVDGWARVGLIDVRRVDPTVPAGSGSPRAWDEVPNRRLVACRIVVGAMGNAPAAEKRVKVDELDQRGAASIYVYGAARRVVGKVMLFLEDEAA